MTRAGYVKHRVGRLASVSVKSGFLHAPIATNLSQLPLPNALAHETLLRPHHPMHAWTLAPSECAPPRHSLRTDSFFTADALCCSLSSELCTA